MVNKEQIVIPQGTVLKAPLVNSPNAKENPLLNIYKFLPPKEHLSTAPRIKDPGENNKVLTIDITEKIKASKLEQGLLSVAKILPDNVECGKFSDHPVMRAAVNGDPNGAYTINYDILYSDSVEKQGDQRWYNFQVTEQKKLTVYMSPGTDAANDNDLLLYQLDTTTYQLSLVSQSKNRAGCYEQLSYIANPGIYYICVVSYQCNQANEYEFLARLTDSWDAGEADDSMALAKAQDVGKITRRTLDNSLDEDCTILLVSTAGTYHIKFIDVPENCNYQLDILSANQQLLTTIHKNANVNLQGVAAGGYFLKVSAPDGVVDPTAVYTLFINQIPATLSDITRYRCDITPDRLHVVEGLHYPAMTALSASNKAAYPEQWVISIDGRRVDIANLDITTTRASQSTYKHKCSGTATPESFADEYLTGTYGSPAPMVNKHVKNAMLIYVKNALYGFYHSEIYDGQLPVVWNNVWTGQYMWFIINIDTNELIDIMYRNWFYGQHDDYPKGVGQEVASFSSVDGQYIRIPGDEPI